MSADQRTPALHEAARQQASRLEQPAPVAPMPTPPPAVAPSASRPHPVGEVRRKAESKSEGTLRTGVRGPEPGPAKEQDQSAAAPSAPPATTPEPEPVTQGHDDTAAVAPPAPATTGAAPPARISPAAENATRAPAPPPLVPRAAMRVPPATDVIGRLTVKDRRVAESALAELISRSGGALVSGRSESDGTTMELVVPRTTYAEFSRELERIGTWIPQGAPALLPPEVRVTLARSRRHSARASRVLAVAPAALP